MLWAAGQSNRLPPATRALLGDSANTLVFSAVSIWEIAIKASLGRADFQVDARLLRRGLLSHGYQDLPMTSEHAVAVTTLPLLHKDPFDRALVAQAIIEGMTLLTADPLVAQYPCPVRLVSPA